MRPYYEDDRVTLYHADALDVLPALEVDGAAIVTDPPYCSGGRQSAGSRGTISKNDSRADGEWFLGDNMGHDSYIWWQREIARACMRIVSPGSMAFVFTDWRQWANLVISWETVRWTLQSRFSWDKDRGGAMGSYWRQNFELAAIFTKGQPRPLAHRSCFNTWRGSKPQGGEHPTVKPLELMRYVCSVVTPRGGVIVDPFMGEGTTGLAAVELGYRFVGVDVEEKYCETAAGLFAAGVPRILSPAETETRGLSGVLELFGTMAEAVEVGEVEPEA